MRFTFLTRLPTLNEYIEAERANKFAGAKLKERYTTDLAYEAISQRQGKVSTDQYDLIINWTVPNNKTDSDNTFWGCKLILDSLIIANIIKSDGRKHIRNIYHNIRTVRGKYQIEV
jgi:hypothetical protein